MTLDTLIMGLGAFIAILPFLGFPMRWDTIFLVIAGVVIIALGITVRRRGLGYSPTSHSGNSYVENTPSGTGHETP